MEAKCRDLSNRSTLKGSNAPSEGTHTLSKLSSKQEAAAEGIFCAASFLSFLGHINHENACFQKHFYFHSIENSAKYVYHIS